MITSLLLATALIGQFGGTSGTGNGGPVIVSSPGLVGTSPLGAGPAPNFAVPDAVKFAIGGGLVVNCPTQNVMVSAGSLACTVTIAPHVTTQAERNYYLKVFIENPF